jgi:hypothetical protein
LLTACHRQGNYCGEMSSEDPAAHGDYEQRVDPGALALATVAGAFAFIYGGGDGDWDALSCVIGSMLVVILFAHHRAAPTVHTPRSYFLRAAFGATTGLALCIGIAPVIQFGIIEPFFPRYDEEGYLDSGAYITTMVLVVLWPIFALLFAVFEPKIARWLDRKPRRSRQKPEPTEL